MNNEQKTRKAFTLVELVVAVALLALILSFSSIIFKVGINSHRIAAANSEIMQKLRIITEQLDADFKGLPTDGFLVLYSAEIRNRLEYSYSPAPANFRADRIYYFSTDDFQSWFNRIIRSNTARIYFGHDANSITNANVPVSRWILARDVVLLTPGRAALNVDYINKSYAEVKADNSGILTDANNLLFSGVSMYMRFDPNNIRRLMCQNIGNILIEWTDGTKSVAPPYSLVWWGLNNPIGGTYGNEIKEISNPSPPLSLLYRAEWTPLTPKQYRPKALKFTFTLYDSKNVLKTGQTFTHIVSLDN